MLRTKLPSETSLGLSLLPKSSNVTKDLAEYIIKNRGNGYFSYEFNYDKGSIPVFITGTEDEKSLPFVRFPLVIRTNDINYIVSNITGSVKSEVGTSIIKNKRNDHVDFEVVRNLTIYQTLADNDLNNLMSMTAQLATVWLVRILRNHLRLNTFDETDVEGAIFNYFIKSYITDIKEDSIRVKMMNLLSLAYKNNLSNTDSVLNKLSTVTANSDIATYINNACPDNAILSKIDTKTILSLISNNWYSGSDNSNIQIFMATENFHTMCGILYHASYTATGKKTLLGRMLLDTKKLTRLDQFIDSVNSLIKDNTIY